jgi:hypothetical protein
VKSRAGTAWAAGLIHLNDDGRRRSYRPPRESGAGSMIRQMGAPTDIMLTIARPAGGETAGIDPIAA